MLKYLEIILKNSAEDYEWAEGQVFEVIRAKILTVKNLKNKNLNEVGQMQEIIENLDAILEAKKSLENSTVKQK